MSYTTFIRNRRQFLLGSSAASLAALLPRRLDAHLAQQQAPVLEIPSRDTTLKFNPGGTRRAFAGNTVICHLPQRCRTRDAITALGDALRRSSFVNKLGVLPSDSYHMTVFPGANDLERDTDTWPADIPIDAPIAQCNQIIGQRMEAFRTHTELPFRISIDLERTLAYGRACTLRIVPADEAENTKLRTLRDRLSDVYRFRAKDHATYEFHVTVAYQMKPFTPQEQKQYRALLEQHLPLIIATAPVIELGIPEYCTFEDMYRFEIRTLLRS